MMTAGAAAAARVPDAAYEAGHRRSTERLTLQNGPDSLGFDGLINLGGGKLERRRVRAYVGADENNIYIAMLTQLPDEGH